MNLNTSLRKDLFNDFLIKKQSRRAFFQYVNNKFRINLKGDAFS